MKANTNLKMNGSFSMLGINHNLKKIKRSGVVQKDINYTSNYGMFKFLDQNRETMDKHIADLAASIKESGQIHAIVVNDKFEIIDGQNRFKACKLLGVPVMYIISK